MTMKETTVIALVALVAATVLAAMKIIGPEQWVIVSGIATGGKSMQGMIDRSKWGARTHANPTTNPG